MALFCPAPHPGSTPKVGLLVLGRAGTVWESRLAQDFHAIGQHLVEVLLHQIREGVRLADSRTVVPSELIVRASTSPPARR